MAGWERSTAGRLAAAGARRAEHDACAISQGSGSYPLAGPHEDLSGCCEDVARSAQQLATECARASNAAIRFRSRSQGANAQRDDRCRHGGLLAPAAHREQQDTHGHGEKRRDLLLLLPSPYGAAADMRRVADAPCCTARCTPHTTPRHAPHQKARGKECGCAAGSWERQAINGQRGGHARGKARAEWC